MEIFEKELMDPQFDNDYHSQMLELSREEKYDSYYKSLDFGTAGMRGKMGVGPNRMHIYKIRRLASAFGHYLLENSDNASCVIAFDSRKSSMEFSREAAVSLASLGVKVHLFRDYSATPELSYAIRALRATGGIVITASHNPPEYNGFKIYDHSGGQLLDEETAKVVAHYEQLPERLEQSTYSQLIEEEKIVFVAPEVLDEYDKALLAAQVKKSDEPLKVVYSALHGVAGRGVKSVLNKMGIDFHPLASQFEPDGDFPEVNYPNPEDPQVFIKALEKARKLGADLILATDPDGDRLGAMVLHEGDYVQLTGDELGLIMAYYLTEDRRGEVIVNLVSSRLIDELVLDRGSKIRRSQIGFKYIGQRMNEIYDFLLAFEESNGYLSLDHTRDKDAIQAAARLCELTRVYKEEGRSLIDILEEIYEKYGYEKTYLLDYVLEGEEGSRKILSLMEDIRENPLSDLDGSPLLEVADYEQEGMDDVKANLLIHYYEGKHWLALRPSGTEPKFKVYFGLRGDDLESLDQSYERIKEQLDLLVWGEEAVETHEEELVEEQVEIKEVEQIEEIDNTPLEEDQPLDD